jgi:3,4-dihydroxy 2-butanone 4-phosphate synthase/GTP cyclohydrolase II
VLDFQRLTGLLVRREADVDLPTRWGSFRLIGYQGRRDGKEHVALVKGELRGPDPVLVRVHSECLTGDVFGSQRCDCGPQLDVAMEMVQQRPAGVIVYTRQEGRGIGLLNKLRAYQLQDQGQDTVEANASLGFRDDQRTYDVAAAILVDLGVRRIELLTNNPRKMLSLGAYGLTVVRRVPLQLAPNPHNQTYLRTKRDKLGHQLDL